MGREAAWGATVTVANAGGPDAGTSSRTVPGLAGTGLE
jgi:hypothetical protein